jgi:hypothetical protein
MKKVEAYVEHLERNNRVLINALLIAGKYARDNLPAELPYNDENFQDYLSIIVNGANRDPEGKEFAALWLQMAKEKNLF